MHVVQCTVGLYTHNLSLVLSSRKFYIKHIFIFIYIFILPCIIHVRTNRLYWWAWRWCSWLSALITFSCILIRISSQLLKCENSHNFFWRRLAWYISQDYSILLLFCNQFYSSFCYNNALFSIYVAIVSTILRYYYVRDAFFSSTS